MSKSDSARVRVVGLGKRLAARAATGALLVVSLATAFVLYLGPAPLGKDLD